MLQYLFFAFLLCVSSAHALWVNDVYVTITASSASQARRQALNEAHILAFQKLQTDQDLLISKPSLDEIMGLVSSFSIVREKTTPTSYTARISFQFHDARLANYMSRAQPPEQYAHPLLHQDFHAFIQSLDDWTSIQRAFGPLEGKADIQSISPQEVSFRLNYRGTPESLSNHLHQQGWALSPTGNMMEIHKIR